MCGGKEEDYEKTTEPVICLERKSNKSGRAASNNAKSEFVEQQEGETFE